MSKPMRPPINPPAFPPHAGSTAPDYMGMSLRDWFAGQALAGFCANQQFMDNTRRELKGERRICDVLSEASYVMADAMLAEKEKSA